MKKINASYEETHTIRNSSIHIHKFVYEDSEKESHCSRHWHMSAELNYYYHVLGEVIIDGNSQKLEGDTLIFVNSQSIHEISITEKQKDSFTIVLLIPYEILSNSIPDFENALFKIDPSDEFIKNQLIEIDNTMKSDDPYFNVKTNALLYHLLYHMCNKYLLISDSKLYIKNTINTDWAFTITQFINENYHLIHSTSDVSNYFHYSREAFCRKFTKTFKCTFNEYLSWIRTQNAVKLLRENNMSHVQVSQACGFPNVKSFKKHILDLFSVSYDDIVNLPEDKYWDLLIKLQNLDLTFDM